MKCVSGNKVDITFVELLKLDYILFLGSSFLNGSRQYDTVRNSTGKQTSYHSTPIGFQRNGNTNGTSSRDAVRRFPPRPSPERLQAQVQPNTFVVIYIFLYLV